MLGADAAFGMDSVALDSSQVEEARIREEARHARWKETVWTVRLLLPFASGSDMAHWFVHLTTVNMLPFCPKGVMVCTN